ncbi:MAG: SGNH/GDSL hydrolase family protein [Lachnospiraceae bacterium]|nr:SGNH/GDSL hydrolase family protein [Lachnospiraceae bacterium]
MRKRILTGILTVMLAVMCACGSQKATEDDMETATGESSIEETDVTENDTTSSDAQETENAIEADTEASEQESSEEMQEEDNSWYDRMVKNSVKSTGNNYRIKKVIEKARNGEDVYIATIGGSVTEGAGATIKQQGYAYQFAKAFAETYAAGDGSNIHFVNAGLGGTPSSLGVIRYDEDVEAELGTQADLILIEFSVNDYMEVTGGRAYEALIYDALSQDNEAAVMLVFAVFESKWNMQNDYIPMGKHYDLPMVSIKNAIEVPVTFGYLTDEEFFADEYHPTTYGHTIMTDCIMKLLADIDAEELEEKNPIPDAPYKSWNFADMKMITRKTEGISIKEGSFTLTDNEVQNIWWDNTNSFPDNWKRDSSAGNDSFVMELTCKNLLLNCKNSGSSDFGTAEVYVDGKLVQTIEGRTDGGWNNSNVVMIIDEEKATKHKVEIRMAKGQEDKSFTILAIGYTQ